MVSILSLKKYSNIDSYGAVTNLTPLLQSLVNLIDSEVRLAQKRESVPLMVLNFKLKFLFLNLLLTIFFK